MAEALAEESYFESQLDRDLAAQFQVDGKALKPLPDVLCKIQLPAIDLFILDRVLDPIKVSVIGWLAPTRFIAEAARRLQRAGWDAEGGISSSSPPSTASDSFLSSFSSSISSIDARGMRRERLTQVIQAWKARPMIINLTKPVLDVKRIDDLFTPPSSIFTQSTSSHSSSASSITLASPAPVALIPVSSSPSAVSNVDAGTEINTPVTDSSNSNEATNDPFALSHTFSNDIYAQYITNITVPSQSGLTLDLIYPAKEKLILKNTAAQPMLLMETYEQHQRIAGPLIKAELTHLSWVYDILEKKAEADRLLMEDIDQETGFMLHPDPKWGSNLAESMTGAKNDIPWCYCKGVALVAQPPHPGATTTITTSTTSADAASAIAAHDASSSTSTSTSTSPSSFSPIQRAQVLADASQSSIRCLALVNRHDLPSLRALNASHLPLLRNLLHTGTRFLAAKFNIPKEHIIAFLHYYPTYYHLHVHYCHVNSVTAELLPGRSHLLADVIENIEMQGDYYQKRTLPVRLTGTHPVGKLLLEESYASHEATNKQT